MVFRGCSQGYRTALYRQIITTENGTKTHRRAAVHAAHNQMVPALSGFGGRVNNRFFCVLAHHINRRRTKLPVGALVPKHVLHRHALGRILGVQQAEIRVIACGVVQSDDVAFFVAIFAVYVLQCCPHLGILAYPAGERGEGHVGAEVEDVRIGGLNLWCARNVAIFNQVRECLGVGHC